MKKAINIVTIIVITIFSLFVFTGCENIAKEEKFATAKLVEKMEGWETLIKYPEDNRIIIENDDSVNPKTILKNEEKNYSITFSYYKTWKSSIESDKKEKEAKKTELSEINFGTYNAYKYKTDASINVVYEIEELNENGEILTVKAVVSPINSDDKNIDLNTIYNLEDVQKILKNIKVKLEKEENVPDAMVPNEIGDDEILPNDENLMITTTDVQNEEY